MLNFINGTALAVQQDQYLQKFYEGGTLSSKEISDMEQNMWVFSASKLAPCNLVIRQYALIDLFKDTLLHRNQILRLLNILTYNQEGYKIYAEGYSYFGYTMDILKLWVEKFELKNTEIRKIIDEINQGFVATSYLRNGILYPAPFGDLRDIPLNADLQILHEIKTIKISNVILNYVDSEKNIWYSLKGAPLGCNTHVLKDDHFVRIVDGVPLNFKFYEGYDKKYKNKFEEYSDTFSFKRLLSIRF